MKKIFYLPIALLLIVAASCGMQNQQAADAPANGGQTAAAKGLYAVLAINPSIRMGDAVQLKFTVYNPADSAQHFLKWQTPFEPLLSKYLDIKNEQGEELQYKGAMAKRMMPPPADAYISIPAKDSLVANVDLMKGYALSKPGKYTITYTSESISGLKAAQSVSFVYR
ncbi:protease [Mucilaginibacter psychrotolerans]|uniref:Protease n=1 Tax=Mucilaginibacter psychrotolerans TaxID=1524096 RepID=A0A4Y8S5Q4_9SPHI|nr:protease [Mucilaginibacter psychrotolerans]TFF34308.1 protease [Mucilaginibacter psychrotolerans]